MNLNAAEKNALNALDVLLQLSKVRVTRRTLRQKLWNHPDFPSLASLSETLDELNVKHLATRITSDNLQEIPLPAITFLQTDGGLLAPLRSVSNNTVEWLHTRKGWQYEPLADFVNKWSGVTLLIEPDSSAGEKNYDIERQTEIANSLRIPFIILGILFCLALLLWLKADLFNTLTASLLIIKATGLIVSTVLIWYSFDSDNPLLRNICQLNNSTNCGGILKSKAAIVFNGLSWSEVGLFYFGGGFLALCLNPVTAGEGLINPLWGFGGISLFYSVYSIYYQAVIAKKWCVLCLIIQCLLTLEVTLGFLYDIPFELPKSPKTWANYGIFYMVIPIAWALVKRSVTQALQTDQLVRTVQRMKFNPNYLRGLSAQQRILPPIFESMKAIHIGKSEAENTLVIVVTPTCAACRRNHKLFKSLLEERHDVQSYIIFAANISDEKDEAVQVGRAILSLPQSEMAAALDSWFNTENNSFNKWSYNLHSDQNYDKGEGYRQLALHLRWCELANVTSTPTVFLNNVELPHEYTVNEMGKLINYFSPQGFDQIAIN